MPMTRSGLDVFDANRVMEIADVFVASMACGAAVSSILLNNDAFNASTSGTASTMKSAFDTAYMIMNI
jgi:hypothetical protein